MRDKLFAYIQLATAMSIAGSSVVISKLIIQRFPVFLASGISLGIALGILLPMTCWEQKGFPKISRNDFGVFFLLAFTGTFLFRVLIFLGLKQTTATNAGIITSTSPAVMGLIAWLALKEKIAYNKILGIICAVTGILWINLMGATVTARTTYTLIGNILVFVAVINEALFTILRKLASESVSSILATTLVSLFGFICFLPLALFEALHFDFASLRPMDWMPLLYYGAIVTVLAFILWFNGLTRVSAGTAAVFSGFMPLSAVALSSIFLKEKIEYYHLGSLILVIIGVFCSSIERSAPSTPAHNT